MSSTTGTVYAALGRTAQLRTLGIVNAAIIVAGFILGMRFGLHGLVVAYFVSTCVVSSLSLGLTLRMLGIPISRFIRSVAFPLLAAAAMAGVVSVTGTLLTRLPVVPHLLLLVGLGAITYTLPIAFWTNSPLRRAR
jgi:PST family polysaccharide transporter